MQQFVVPIPGKRKCRSFCFASASDTKMIEPEHLVTSRAALCAISGFEPVSHWILSSVASLNAPTRTRRAANPSNVKQASEFSASNEFLGDHVRHTNFGVPRTTPPTDGEHK